MSKNKFKQERKLWYRGLKNIMKVKYKRPEFVYLSDKPTNGSIILSNHVGTDAPMALEIYADFPVRMWGTYKMNSGLIKMYKYQSKVYYHEKKHWNLFGARMFCLIASPLTNLFYKGLNLISTYQDTRFKNTLDESHDAIINKKENIVIFPEKSTEGYLDQLQGFYAGFVVLAQTLAHKGVDVPIFVAYYKKNENKYIFGKSILFSQLKDKFEDRNQIAEYLVNECNALRFVGEASENDNENIDKNVSNTTTNTIDNQKLDNINSIDNEINSNLQNIDNLVDNNTEIEKASYEVNDANIQKTIDIERKNNILSMNDEVSNLNINSDVQNDIITGDNISIFDNYGNDEVLKNENTIDSNKVENEQKIIEENIIDNQIDGNNNDIVTEEESAKLYNSQNLFKLASNADE